MRSGELVTGGAKLRNALKVLLVRWETTKGEWNDPVSRQFETEFLDGLEPEVTNTLERLSNLAQVMVAAEQECGEYHENL